MARRGPGTRIMAAAFVAVLLLAVAGVADAKRRPRRWSHERWRKTLSSQKYDAVVSTTHHLLARDGASLSLTLHLPDGLPDDVKIPTLLQITPYQPIDQALPGAYGDYHFFVLRGAAYVEADARGTGGSEGCLDFGGSLDRSDARAFVSWIQKQPWSNGVVVTDGISHPGMGSVVAHAAVPGLTAALAHAPVVSYYQDEWLQGAKFEDQFNGPGYQAIETLPPQPPEYADPESLKNQAATCTGQTTLDFSVYDGPFTDKWEDRDLSRHVPRERKPILLTHGFVDLNVHPDHSQLYWDALPDDYPKYAIFGYWYHGYPDLVKHPFALFHEVRHRWLDATLFGIENGLWHEPRVLVEDSTGTWHEGHDWPLEQSRPVTFYPSAGGSLSPSVPRSGEASWTDRAGAERGTWEDASVVFRSAPLSASRLVNGAPRVELVASSSESSTKWVAYLIDEAPDGSWERVSHGYADSHTWGKEHEWLEMQPGKKYRFTLELMPTAVVLEKGHRLVLVVASSDSSYMSARCFSDYRRGCYSPSGILPATSYGRATNTLRTGRDGTSVRLHWVDPAKTHKPPR